MFTYLDNYSVRIALTKSEVDAMIETLIMVGGGEYVVMDQDGNILQRGRV